MWVLRPLHFHLLPTSRAGLCALAPHAASPMGCLLNEAAADEALWPCHGDLETKKGGVEDFESFPTQLT